MFWWERAGTFGLHHRAWEHVCGLPFPKVVHGVGFAVGGTVAPPSRYLPLFRSCVDDVGAAWASNHLAFNWFHGPEAARCTGFFLPPRQTDDGVRAAVASIRAMTAALSCPFAVETGVNYFRPRSDELPDGEFVSRVCKAADCWVLLDLHNIWANQSNGRQSIDDYLAALPLDRVIEVHVAGGFSLDGFWLDAHSGVPPDGLLDVLDEVLPRLSMARAVCFEILAPFVSGIGVEAVAAALERIRRSWERPRGRVSSTLGAPALATPIPGPGAVEWEQTVGALVIGSHPMTPLAQELVGDPAIQLLRKLVGQTRAGMVTDGLPLTLRLLLNTLGSDDTFALLERFWQEVSPQPFALTESEAFARWLREQNRSEPFLADALSFDLASGDAESTGEPVEVSLSIDPREFCETLARGGVPTLREGRVIATVIPSDR